jgi:proline iminopeptidase
MGIVKNTVLIASLFFLGLAERLVSEEPVSVGPETVLDRKVHTEEKLILEIPQIGRLCDKLGLEKRTVNIGDCKLYCELDGDKTPLVLLHGGPGATHHYFHPWFSRAARFARVIYYDQRGCGLSEYVKGTGYSVDQAVEDLENLRKALGIDRWIVLGHSYGGLLAQRYAIKYPERLRGLVLVGADLGMAANFKPGREYDFIAPAERKRLGAIKRDPKLTVEQKIYNAFLNGDWKRQCFYKPSKERIAQIARYEWKQDVIFNPVMSADVRRTDLTGAFEGCPIPTLIIEGKWDLTWSADKAEIFSRNHPGARLVVYGRAGHVPFEDEPDRFFALLKDFTAEISARHPPDVSPWLAHLAQWQQATENSPQRLLTTSKSGLKSAKKIAAKYSKEWLNQVSDPIQLFRLGMFLYDAEKYSDALVVFQELEKRQKGEIAALASLWQGQMLDLLDRRQEAIAAYAKAKGSHLDVRDDAHGLKFNDEYVEERLRKHFERVENHWKD